MKIRKTCPKNNKYYIRKQNGGYNGAVLGHPVVKGANVLCNCVGYANGRFNEIIGKKKCVYQLVCNAENFIESAKKQGLKISKTPKVGGIMVWQKGATLGGGDGAGHVAVVEAVYSDGTILTSESGYDAWAFKNIKRSNKNGRWGQSSAYKFRGCIINPSVKHTVTKTEKLKKELEACKKQAEWMKDYKYGWESKPTVPKSKKKGTCVTYVACALQRIGILKSGQYIWHNEKGKVTHANDKMKVIYPKGKTLKGYKKYLKAGDIVMAGKASDVGAGSHIFILTGKWKDGDPYIYDNHSAERVRRGKSPAHTYNGKKKIIAVVRLK